MDCSPPSSTIHGISQARILEWVAISFFRRSSQPRDRTRVSCFERWILYHWATRCSVTQLCLTLVTPWTASCQASLSFTIFLNLLQLMSIESVMPSNHLILCPLLFLPSILPSIRVFSSGWALHIRWPKYWRFSFSISSFWEYSGLISFRIDWVDLLAVQGALKSLLQHRSSKASILWHSTFFMVQLLHLYMKIGKKNHTFGYLELCQQSMSLLLNILSRFVIAFLPRSKHL